MLIDTLERQHRELLEISDSVLAALPAAAELDAPGIRSLLVRLLGRLTVHLVTEDEQVYPLLLHHRDPQVRAVTERFRGELGGLARAVDEYKATWPGADSILQRPAAFIHHTRILLAALAKRIRREDTELYVLLPRS